VAVFVAFGKVFSPQYLIWLIPLVPLVAGLPGVVASLLTGASLALTQFWFPNRYLQYAFHLDGLETAFVVARDLAVVALVVVLLRALAEPSSRREARAAPVPQVGADLAVPA
jgi:hypothetical protein